MYIWMKASTLRKFTLPGRCERTRRDVASSGDLPPFPSDAPALHVSELLQADRAVAVLVCMRDQRVHLLVGQQALRPSPNLHPTTCAPPFARLPTSTTSRPAQAPNQALALNQALTPAPFCTRDAGTRRRRRSVRLPRSNAYDSRQSVRSIAALYQRFTYLLYSDYSSLTFSGGSSAEVGAPPEQYARGANRTQVQQC